METRTLERVVSSKKQHDHAPTKTALKIEDTTRRLLEQSHSQHFPKERIAAGKFHGSDYRKRAYEYLVDTGKLGIEIETALRFHNAEIYETDKRNRKDCSGGQLPGLLVFSNASGDYTHSILSESTGWVTSHNQRAGRAFGMSMNIRNKQQVSCADDFIAAAYMIGHMIDEVPVGCQMKNGKLAEDALVPYMWFSGSYGKQDKTGELLFSAGLAQGEFGRALAEYNKNVRINAELDGSETGKKKKTIAQFDQKELQKLANLEGRVNLVSKKGKDYYVEKTTGPDGEKLKLYECRRSRQDVIQLAMQRRARFMEDCKNAGYEICNGNTPYMSLYSSKEKSITKVYLPVIVHDLEGCKYYVVEEGGKKLEEFAHWASRMGLNRLNIVKKHIDAIDLHKTETDYFNDLVMLSSQYKGAFCVDSRHMKGCGSMVKDLGGILTRDIAWGVFTNPLLREFTIYLHLPNCGYLTTAMKVHELGLEIHKRVQRAKRLLQKNEAVGNLTDEDIRDFEASYHKTMMKILTKKRGEQQAFAFDYAKFKYIIDAMGGNEPMPEYMDDFLKDLLRSTLSDTRNTIGHMQSRGMLAWDKELKTVVMPAAREVDKMLGLDCHLLQPNRKKDGSDAAKREQNEYYALVTLKVAQMEERYWNDFLAAREDQILLVRKDVAKKLKYNGPNTARLPRVVVQVENTDTGEVYAVHDWKQAEKNASLTEVLKLIDVRDAITGLPLAA